MQSIGEKSFEVLSAPAHVVCGIALQKGCLVINPGGPVALELATPMLTALKDGRVPAADNSKDDHMPPSNKPLLDAMERLAREGTSARALFYGALMQSRPLIVSRTPVGPPGELQIVAETQVQLRVVMTPDGRSLLPAFTDRAAALSRGYTDFLVGLSAQPLLKLAQEHDGLVINPSGPYPTELSRDEIRYLLGQVQPD